MKRRHLLNNLFTALEDTPVVYLQGPRQTGKSTLAQSLTQSGYKAEYFTLDDAAVLGAAQADPDGFISGLPERVIFDETPTSPGSVSSDQTKCGREPKAGRFLLTGSAQALTLPKVSESLAGWMEVLTLWPFSQGQIEGKMEGFVDACFRRELKPGRIEAITWRELVERIVKGGYPEAVARDDSARQQS